MLNKPAKYSDPWFSAKGLLYFIAAGRPPVAIKIGVTKRESYATRLKGIQSSNHEPIEAIGVIEFNDGEKPMVDAEAHERELHRQFGGLQRVRAGTVGQEWFEATPELIAFVLSNSKPPGSSGLPKSVGHLAASNQPLQPTTDTAS